MRRCADRDSKASTCFEDVSRSLHHWAEVSHWEAQNRYPRICGDLCKSSILHRSYHDMEFLSKCRSTHVRVLIVVFIMMHLCRRWAGKAQDSPLLEATLTPQSPRLGYQKLTTFAQVRRATTTMQPRGCILICDLHYQYIIFDSKICHL